MKKNYVIPETFIVKLEPKRIIASSFDEKGGNVVSDGYAGSRSGGIWNWMDNDE